MSKINIEFKDRIVEFPNRYSLTDNGDGTYTLTPFPGEITEEGTPVNAADLNKMCNAINSALLQSVTFTESGVWVCPQGVSTVDVWVVGGGGGGGDASDIQGGSTGGGGTGGECNLFTVPVTAGQTYEVIVGNGGYKAAGGYSQFGSSTYRSNGGARGSDNTIFGGGCAGGPLSSTKDGVGGVPESINPYNNIPYAAGGGAGHYPVGGDGGICGGGGGGGITSGKGGIGYNGLQSGNDGAPPSQGAAHGGNAGDNTGAGGGGARSSAVYGASGGRGGSGIVIIYYRQILND